MSYTFTFDGVSSADHDLIISDRRWEMAPPVANAMQSVPGRVGSYLVDSEQSHRTLVLTVAFVGSSTEDSQARLHALASWLVTSSPRQLVLSDDPGVAYNAKYDGAMVPANIVSYRKGDLTFIIPDPYAYAPTETETSLVVGLNTVTNSGGVDAFPRYTVELAGATNAIRLTSGASYIQIGTPADETQTGTDPAPVSFLDDCGDMSGWTAGTMAEFGTAAGTMESDGSTMSPKHAGGSFGTATLDWHGPPVGIDLATHLTDFEVKAWVGMANVNDSQCRIEAYLLDASGNVLGKMDIHDSWDSMAKVEAYFRCGVSGTGHSLLTTTGNTATALNNFYGHIRLSRQGDLWTAGVAKCYTTSRVRVWSKKATWLDTAGTYGADLARVEIRIAQYHDHTVPTTCYFDEVGVTGLSAAIPAGDPVVIGQAGDVFEIDSYAAVVRRNGEPYMGETDFGSTFFPVASGAASVSLDVDGSITSASAFVRERWL